jgi:hypothetical protein
LFTLIFPRRGEDEGNLGNLQSPEFHESQWLDDDDGNPGTREAMQEIGDLRRGHRGAAASP